MLSRLSARWNLASTSRLAVLVAFTASAWATLYSIFSLTRAFVASPVHLDFRVFYAAAWVSAHHGFAYAYDLAALRAASAGFPSSDQFINSHATYINPPLLAFLLLPFTLLSEPHAYLSFIALSLLCLVWTWYLVAPFTAISRLTLLLLALGIWPLSQVFYYGQPILLVFLLIALSYRFLRSRHDWQSAFCLSLAFFLKPQILFLLPLVLAASGRWRHFAFFAAWSSALALSQALLIGVSGLHSYASALIYVQSDGGHSFFTFSYLFVSPLSYAVMVLCATLSLLVAQRRSIHLEIVFAVGLLGSLLASPHLHQPDYALLVLAVWFCLRLPLSRAHFIFLLLGIVPLQLVTLGSPAPVLIWEFAWLLILLAPIHPLTWLPRQLAWLARPLSSPTTSSR